MSSVDASVDDHISVTGRPIVHGEVSKLLFMIMQTLSCDLSSALTLEALESLISTLNKPLAPVVCIFNSTVKSEVSGTDLGR